MAAKKRNSRIRKPKNPKPKPNGRWNGMPYTYPEYGYGAGAVSPEGASMVIGEPWATPARKAKKAMPAIAATTTSAETILRPVLFPFILYSFCLNLCLEYRIRL